MCISHALEKNAFLTSFCKDLNKEKNLKQANDFICTCDVPCYLEIFII